MKTVIKLFILCASTILCASAWAQVSSITVGSGSGLPGDTGIVVPVNLSANGDNIASIDMTVTFTTATQYNLISVDCSAQTVSNNAFPRCSVAGNVVTIQMAEAGGNAWISGLLANITVDIAGGAVPLVDDPLVATVVGAGDNDGIDIPLPTATDGTFTVLSGPQPDWSSAPTSAAGIDFGSHTADSGPYSMDLVVTNAGATGSTLTGTCDVSGSAVFSIPGDDSLGTGLASGASATITAVCDTAAAAVQLHTGTMSCTHNGDGSTETSITDYTLNCNVTASPEPSFLGVDNGLAAMATGQGDGDATATLTVSNNGDSGTTLIGSCLYTGDTEITVTNNTFAIAQGTAGVDVLATCSAAAAGTYTGSLTCSPTGTQTWVAPDSPYAVSCTVGPPGAAVYSSDPAPGSVFDMTTPGEPVPVGTMIPTQDLVITNDPPEANDGDLVLLDCGLMPNMPVGDAPQADSGAISASAIVTPLTLAPYESTTVTFSCDSSVVGDFSDTYSCSYDVDGDGTADGTATYTVKCAIREAESEVSESPESGSNVTIFAPIGGVGQGSVVFTEVLDEDEDATLDNCYLDDDTYFTIVSPASFPQTISSGESVAVLVEGMGTDDGQPTTTTLHCDYTDSQNVSAQVSWPLDVVILTAEIPTLSTWGLMLMILTLLGLGGLVIRRKELS